MQYRKLRDLRRVARRAGRTRRAALSLCTAIVVSPVAWREALPRALRWPWQGAYVSMARAAGYERIETSCNLWTVPTCHEHSVESLRAYYEAGRGGKCNMTLDIIKSMTHRGRGWRWAR